MMETLEQKIARVTAEQVAVVPYDTHWPAMFEAERMHLFELWPAALIVRIEHFGSTAVPGLDAKPIIDMLIEVNDVERAKDLAFATLEPLGYDCFWRPSFGDDIPPWYTWCIKRDGTGARTHHLHIGEVGFKMDELRFRDILRTNSRLADDYGQLKRRLAAEHRGDRISYTQAKGEFISAVLG